jgi:ATP-dependent RNA helicase RhlE
MSNNNQCGCASDSGNHHTNNAPKKNNSYKKSNSSSSHSSGRPNRPFKSGYSKDRSESKDGYVKSDRGNESRGGESRSGQSHGGQSRGGESRGGSSRGGEFRGESRSGGSRGGSRRGGNGGGRGRSFGGGRGRHDKRFNPSDFIRKVDQQVVEQVQAPKHMFEDFALEPVLKKSIAKRGYTTPTPIQDQAIPVLLEGKDIIATANTGTGKTAAFLIPMINNVLTKKSSKVLIITPTRELAAQIQEELVLLKGPIAVSTALCIGGLNIRFQIQKLRRNPAFVIGTPGRLRDLEENREINFNDYTSIVLDEVDTMLDMGFIEDIKYIISKLPQQRHSLFFSATISPAVQLVMKEFLTDPVSVSVKTRELAATVNQDVIKVGSKSKIEVLHELLIKPEFSRTIIFLKTKHGTETLGDTLKDRGFGVTTIHGNKTQAQRKRALDAFKDNKVKILLATDVVARGIDIDNVSHVINYDLPQTREDYIHRIGRTGRANKVGQALTFLD